MNAWIVYLLAAVLLLASLYYLTRRWAPLRWRALVLAALGFVLFTPAAIPGSDQWAPAWQVGAFEYLLGSRQVAAQALWPLGLMFVALFAALLGLALRRRRSRGASQALE